MSFILDKNRSFYVLGIVNTTPDSFYDGGNFNDTDRAFKQALKLIEEGADIIDVGGESSRPGAEPVSVEEELERVIPLITRLNSECNTVISIDTVKAEVARAALDAGASIVNDISGGRRDPEMIPLVSSQNCYTVIMHSRKTPKDMQRSPYYENVVEEVLAELQESVERFLSAGLKKDRVILDPGIGFAKRVEDNLALLKASDKFIESGYELLIGTSRKSFIGALTDRDAEDRLSGSLASIASPFLQGARFFRVHDVKETVDFLKVMDGINKAS